MRYRQIYCKFKLNCISSQYYYNINLVEMRKYVSLGSALMMGEVLGKETKADIKPILAQKHYIGEVVYM